MTLIQDIESAWLTNIWQHDTILNITPNAFPLEVVFDSEFEVGRCYYRQKVNYFEYVISARESFPLIGGGLSSALFNVQAEIRYTIEQDTTGAVYQTAKEMPNTITRLVCSELGESWDGTVDFFNVGEEPINVTEEIILSTRVWRVIFSFTAQVFTQI